MGADVAGAAKNAVSDVKDAAKSAASKLPGQGSKPVAFYGQGLQVNVGLPNPVEQVPSNLVHQCAPNSLFLPPNAVLSERLPFAPVQCLGWMSSPAVRPSVLLQCTFNVSFASGAPQVQLVVYVKPF